MARQDHKGKRRPRHERIERRNLSLGYYLIYTDTKETEGLYFRGLHSSLPVEIRDKLQIKIVEDIKTEELVKAASRDASYNPQLRETWIIFDHDEVPSFDKIIEKAKEKGLKVGWSNPCIEIWLHAYLGNLNYFNSPKKCIEKLKDLCYRQMKEYEYSKNDENIYKRFCRYGDEKRAISLAKSRYEQFLRDGINTPSEMNPCTTIYQLVEEIRSKV